MHPKRWHLITLSRTPKTPRGVTRAINLEGAVRFSLATLVSVKNDVLVCIFSHFNFLYSARRCNFIAVRSETDRHPYVDLNMNLTMDLSVMSHSSLACLHPPLISGRGRCQRWDQNRHVYDDELHLSDGETAHVDAVMWCMMFLDHDVGDTAAEIADSNGVTATTAENVLRPYDLA